MPISIAVITARQSINNILACNQEMSRVCKVTYLPYDSLTDLYTLYTRNLWKFDGFLFSGSFPRDYILESTGPISKPYRCLDLKDRDYYLMIARLFAQNPGLNFSRVYLDTIVDPAILHTVFQGQGGPFLPDYSHPLEYRDILRSASYERYLNAYRDFWQQRRFDIFVTRFTNLAQRLSEEQIPHFLLQPSKATILDHFHDLVSDIRESVIQHSLTACCVIALDPAQQLPEHYDALERLLNDFCRSKPQGLVLRKNLGHFEIITSALQASALTAEYTSCLLSDALYHALPFPVYVGWGMGFDIAAAFKNAKRAVQESRRDRRHFAYLVTEGQEMVGPLNGHRSLSYDLRPDPRLCSVAKSIGIAPVNLEKMLSLQKSRQMFEFSSSDLVYFLEVTPRSASRILTRLADCGLARPVRRTNLNGTGRPTTIYEIDFSSISS